MRRAAPVVLDVTGVGVAVAEMFQTAGVYPIRVTITGGEAETCQGHGAYSVPKRDLFCDLLVAFQEKRLLIPGRLAEGPSFQRELFAVTTEYTPGGRAVFKQEGDPEVGGHADLVLATALAYWHARTPRSRPPGSSLIIPMLNSGGYW